MGSTVPVPVTLVVNPGDRVLVGLHRDDITQEEAVALRDQLTQAFPNVQFVIVAGVSALAVGPQEDS